MFRYTKMSFFMFIFFFLLHSQFKPPTRLSSFMMIIPSTLYRFSHSWTVNDFLVYLQFIKLALNTMQINFQTYNILLDKQTSWSCNWFYLKILVQMHLLDCMLTFIEMKYVVFNSLLGIIWISHSSFHCRMYTRFSYFAELICHQVT